MRARIATAARAVATAVATAAVLALGAYGAYRTLWPKLLAMLGAA